MAGLKFGQDNDDTTVNDPARPGEQSVGPVDLPNANETVERQNAVEETPKEEKLVNVLYVGSDTYKSDELGTLSKGDERAVSAAKADELASTGDFVRV